MISIKSTQVFALSLFALNIVCDWSLRVTNKLIDGLQGLHLWGIILIPSKVIQLTSFL